MEACSRRFALLSLPEASNVRFQEPHTSQDWYRTKFETTQVLISVRGPVTSGLKSGDAELSIVVPREQDRDKT